MRSSRAMEDVNRVLREANRPVPGTAPLPGGRALVAGATGRRGEAMLNAVLARGGYDTVAVLAEQPVAMGIKNLEIFARDSVPAARDLFILMSAGEDDMGRSLHGRDAAFVQMDETNLRTLAEKAVAAGVQRIALVAPAPLLLQFGSMHRGLANDTERFLDKLTVQRLLVVRPLRQYRGGGANLAQRVANLYLQVQMLMMPRAIEPVTSEQLARAVLHALNRQDSGLTVVPAADIAQESRAAMQTHAEPSGSDR